MSDFCPPKLQSFVLQNHIIMMYIQDLFVSPSLQFFAENLITTTVILEEDDATCTLYTYVYKSNNNGVCNSVSIQIVVHVHVDGR